MEDMAGRPRRAKQVMQPSALTALFTKLGARFTKKRVGPEGEVDMVEVAAPVPQPPRPTFECGSVTDTGERCPFAARTAAWLPP